MRCERCQFAPPPDSEGYCDECGCFEKYGKTFSDGSYGCTLNYQTLRKWQEQKDEDLGNMGEDMGISMDFENNGWDLQDALHVMMHMIGVYPEGVRRTYKRHGKVFYKPYRNYFAGENKYLDYFSGSLGIVEKTLPEVTDKMPYYRLTEHGMKFLGRQLKIKIHPEEG